MRRLLTFAALTITLTVSACSDNKPSAAPSPAAPAVTVSTQAADASGLAACALVAKASAGDTDGTAMTNPSIVLPITQAAAMSTTPAIQQAGEELGARYRDAILAKGTDDEVTMKVQAVTAATELRTACITAGLEG